MTASLNPPVTIRIDMVSDVVCPWCAIGLTALEQALARLDGVVQAEIHFQPFELNPQMPREGEPVGEHLRHKYGLSEAQLAENQQRIRDRGAELGFVFDMDARTRIVNTFDAHRLLHWAGEVGRQRELKHALLRAYFSEGRNVADPAVLRGLAEGVGLDGERAAAILGGDEYAAEVRLAEQFYLRNGISGVPAFIFDQRQLISGGQPVEVFERALRQYAEAKRREAAAAP